ncbi:MAG: Uma2 family endonuclease [Planctomycetaceae bacterium]|nr:Uma2 family endonuclease [Planctomycetaceae bacterium]
MLPEIGLSESALLTDLAMCINYYRLFSPGLYCCVHAPLQLDDATCLRPGIIVMVNHGELKQCDPGPDYECFRGPPNFVLDVFPGDDLQDYAERRAAFERAGVQEYVAVRHTEPVSWVWNRLVDGKFAEIKTPDDEFIVSSALPGLWIPALALQQRDWWTIMATIARGVSRIGHHDFMETIWKGDPSRQRG